MVEPDPVEADFYDYEIDGRTVRAKVVATVRIPWGLDFLPDGRLLISEKQGGLAIFDPVTEAVTEVQGLPSDIQFTGQGGMLDVAVSPDFENGSFIFLSYTVKLDDGYSVRVVRMKLIDYEVSDLFEIVLARPSSPHALNFGSRFEFDSEGWMYVTMSDHKHRPYVQDLSSHLGKTLRYDINGKPGPKVSIETPADTNALPEIFTIGHRNPQGLVLNDATGEFWSTEHGEQGGDEVNLLSAGKNYGWPVVTHSEEYGGGKIGIGSEAEGYVSPRAHFTPSIAPSQLDFYRGEAFPEWQGQLFIATLGRGLIRVPRTEDGQLDWPNADRRLLLSPDYRIRDLAMDPNGFIYAAIDKGWLLRIEPGKAVVPPP